VLISAQMKNARNHADRKSNVPKSAHSQAHGMKSMNSCGDNLARLRKIKRISQHSLGKAVGLGRDAIAKIEGRNRCVTDTELIVLSKVLDCSCDELIFGSTQEHGECAGIDTVCIKFAKAKHQWEAIESNAVMGLVKTNNDIRNALLARGATEAQISFLLVHCVPLLGQDEMWGSIAGGVEISISRDGSAELFCNDTLVLFDPEESHWCLPTGDLVYRDLSHALQVVRSV